MLENIRLYYRTVSRRINYLPCIIVKLSGAAYSFYTTFPQKMWKTIKTPLFLRAFLIMLCVLPLLSCSSSKKAQKSHPALDNTVISMTEAEVKRRLGEPDVVSKTPESKIIWTYIPHWKIMPDNKDTIYIEFEEGKVVKIIKGRE